MKPGSMNLFHSASIRKCSHKNSEALKNASNEIRKYEITSKGTRITSELKYDISNASLASIALKSVTSQKTIHFKKSGNEKIMTENCQNWKWPKRIPYELSRWRSRRWFCTPTAKVFPWRASVVRFSAGLNILHQNFISLQYYTGKQNQMDPNWLRTSRVRDPVEEWKHRGKYSISTGDDGKTVRAESVSSRKLFDGFWGSCFLLKVRDCHNPTVVLVPLGNS